MVEEGEIVYELEEGEIVEDDSSNDLEEGEIVKDGSINDLEEGEILDSGSMDGLEEGELIESDSFIQVGISANQISQVYVPTLYAKLSEDGGQDNSLKEPNIVQQLGTFANRTFSKNCEHASQVTATRGPFNESKVISAGYRKQINFPRRKTSASRNFPAGSGSPRTQLKKTSQHKYVGQNTSKSIFRERKNEDEDAKHFSRHDKTDSRVAKNSSNSDNVPTLEADVARNKVTETLHLFRSTCKEEKGRRRRVDLVSASILQEKNKWINTGDKQLGIVPGVEVGLKFHYRVELSIIGLHGPYWSGIDYMPKDGKIVATSIVASRGYDDYMCGPDVLIYSGQGGCPWRGVTPAEDQKLEKGNLALKNSIDEGTPVRVIRGLKGTNGHDSRGTRNDTAATMTYDGLYIVSKCWKQIGLSGNIVFMFQLNRNAGQPELAINESKKASVHEGICVNDISYGREKIPIGVNTIDDEIPPLFIYITNMIYPLSYNPTPHRGCECRDGCSSSMKCSCANKNGRRIPFYSDGTIVKPNTLVYECGPSCKCPPSCFNRVSQHGIRFQLEIFKTESRGWGVRSLSHIPPGSFICEYTGEFLQNREAEKRTANDKYLFDVGHKYDDHALWDGLSNLKPSNLKSSSSCKAVEDVGFTIDAAQYGNVGRFINHSCSPNLFAQNVLYDHEDKRMPHIMLFAAENIPPLMELTYHYNMAVDQVYDSNGNIKKKNW